MAEDEGSTSPVKACKVCGETKPLTKFPKNFTCADGREGRCTWCKAQARSPAGKARGAERAQAWKRDNPERWRDLKIAQAERRRRREGVRPLVDLVAEAEAKRADRRAKRIAAQHARWRDKPWTRPGLSVAERWRQRYALDPAFNLAERVRTALRHERDGIKLGELLRSAIRRDGSSPSAARLLGYNTEQLKDHIERQFVNGMGWPAFLRGEIHLDHILPLSCFDLTDRDELLAAWALTNLRPMWGPDNLAKGKRRDLLL